MNIFTDTIPPPILQALIYDKTPHISAHDIPYFHIRSLREYKDQPIHHEPMRDITEIIIDERFADISDVKQLGTEAEFLKATGLGFEKDDVFYISSVASSLYSTDGVFANYSVANTPEEKATALAPYIDLLTDYILPGLYWRSYYAYSGLPDRIGIARHLQQQMLEVSKLWSELKEDAGAGMYAYNLAESAAQISRTRVEG